MQTHWARTILVVLCSPTVGCAADGTAVAGAPAEEPAPARTLEDAGPRSSPTDGSGADTVCSPGDSRPCYDGPPETRGSGICQEGTQHCIEAGEFGTWGECSGQITPDDTPTGTCDCSPENLEAAGDDAVPDRSPPLCGGAHTACDCQAAGGEWVDIGETCRVCRFDAPECPDGWTHYDNWITSATNTECPNVETRFASSGTDECDFIDIPFVHASTGTYLLSCERSSDYCCGTPPDNSDGHLTAEGRPWSSHEPDTRSWVQGYNRCGCACGPEHCTTTTISCVASITQIGCT
jgi:hypothetical protein